MYLSLARTTRNKNTFVTGEKKPEDGAHAMDVIHTLWKRKIIITSSSSSFQKDWCFSCLIELRIKTSCYLTTIAIIYYPWGLKLEKEVSFFGWTIQSVPRVCCKSNLVTLLFNESLSLFREMNRKTMIFVARTLNICVKKQKYL